MQINSFLSPAFLLISRSLNITVFNRTVNCCNKSCSCFSCFFFFFPFASCKIIPSYGQEQFAYLGNEYQKSLLFHCPPPVPPLLPHREQALQWVSSSVYEDCCRSQSPISTSTHVLPGIAPGSRAGSASCPDSLLVWCLPFFHMC